uniref:Uncharacterized protein n=1 Tax=Arundo donax TaxID=35708 RepID=A0A0A8Y2E6_ARUDO
MSRIRTKNEQYFWMADGRFPAVHTENFFMIRIFFGEFSSFFFVWR